jgi:hypothetical protein
MKSTHLRIAIPKPCKENFAEMLVSGDGKFCGKCDTVIYDFSEMTDAALLRFFENRPETHCGRFHNTQLNRKIETLKIKNKFFQKILTVAASVIALLTLRNVSAYAQGEVKFPVAQSAYDKNNLLTIHGDYMIKGIVKDRENNPLKNVKVNFDDLHIATTNEKGEYKIELKGVNSAHNIYYSCINYVTTVRTFNPVMGNTDFNVELGRRDTNAVVYSMGIMAPPLLLGTLPVLNFQPKKIILNAEIKDILTYVATQLKSIPDSKIEVHANTKMHSGEADKIGFKRLELIKSFLVNKQGISPDRIFTNLEMDGGDVDIIEILSN